MSSKVCMILVWFFVICLLVVGLVMVSSTAAWAEETKHPYEPLFTLPRKSAGSFSEESFGTTRAAPPSTAPAIILISSPRERTNALMAGLGPT